MPVAPAGCTSTVTVEADCSSPETSSTLILLNCTLLLSVAVIVSVVLIWCAIGAENTVMRVVPAELLTVLFCVYVLPALHVPVPVPVQQAHGFPLAVHAALLESAIVGAPLVVLSTTQTMTALSVVVSCAGLQAIVPLLVNDVAAHTVLITSAAVAVGVGLFVAVRVGVLVGVAANVGVGLFVCVGVAVSVAVEVLIGAGVGVCVGVNVEVTVEV